MCENNDALITKVKAHFSLKWSFCHNYFPLEATIIVASSGKYDLHDLNYTANCAPKHAG